MNQIDKLISSLIDDVAKRDNVRRINKFGKGVNDAYSIELTDDQPRIFNHITGRTLANYVTNSKTGDKGKGTYANANLWSTSRDRGVNAPIAHLVLFHFVGPRPPGFTAEHKDGDKCNNALTNLEWLDKSSQILRQPKRTKVGANGSGRPVTDVHNTTGAVEQYANATTAWNAMSLLFPRQTSGVGRINTLAKGDGAKSRGLDRTWSYTYTAEDARVDALEWRQVPPKLINWNTTAYCSIEGHVKWNGRIATQGTEKATAYMKVCIDTVSYDVQRLVAAAWYGYPPQDYVADHADGNTSNNRPDNLGWVSKSENGDRSRYKKKPIEKIHPLTGEVLRTYETYMHAVRDTGITEGIGRAISSRQKADKKLAKARRRVKNGKVKPKQEVVKAGDWHWRCATVFTLSDEDG